MWGYYGSKSKIINYYPSPLYQKIIEPFAGTARYSLKYWNNEITLIDKYDIIIKLWKYLQQVKPSDILNIRKLKCGENVDDFDWDCEEQKWLVGFIITGAPSSPKKTASRWKTIIRPNTQNYKLKFIANNLYKIKDWEIKHGSYESVKNEEATWFIDPPYTIGGGYYKFGNKDINYAHLSKWCTERYGQVIVCEKTGADWLPFKHLISSRGNLYQHNEAIWHKTGGSMKLTKEEAIDKWFNENEPNKDEQSELYAAARELKSMSQEDHDKFVEAIQRRMDITP